VSRRHKDYLIAAPDDGLPAAEVGPWAVEKYRRVGMYAEIFSTGMKNRWDCRAYIDLFAGPGHAVIRRLVRQVLAVAVALAGLAHAAAGQDSTLRILQLDVGQGDAALVITPENRRLLIDAGRSPRSVASMLQQLGVDTIHLAVASHAHADHIGGMAAILASFPVRAYLDNGLRHTTQTYRRTLDAVERSRAQYLEATERTITLGSLVVRVIPRPFQQSSQNNGSVGLLLEFGEFRALYTGDAERWELEGWLKAGVIPEVTVIKVAHHGGRKRHHRTMDSRHSADGRSDLRG
jgi:beta-lactamase superfamily II metal-dependent hydrolase